MSGGLFTEPNEHIRWLGSTSNGISLSELKDVPCLILLGDVGMGKSTTVRTEATLLKSMFAGQQHVVLYEDLKRLSEWQIERRIFGNREVEAWVRGEHALTLILDSLDECWRRIDALEILLVDEFRRRIRQETGPLFLRLTCRSAEWRGDAGKTLERLFSTRNESIPPLQIYVLAPLSANNIREAAVSSHLDGERLLERIAAKGSEALASHPITFEMLLQLYQENGDFPASRSELYQTGCLRLCADEQVSFGASQQRKTTPPQRFVAAGRLAALSVFTNRFLINGDPEHPASRHDVLEVTDATGHTDEQIGGERLVVDRDTITETLQTALFADRIEGAQSWSHQSYAEFLAAQYVMQRGLPASQVIAVLTDTTDNAQRVVPQLEETACWMAEMLPAVFSALAPRNADTLLRCDPSYWSDSDRALLVGSYLNLVHRHEAAELDWQLKDRLARLAHPGLAAQLRPAIAERSENPLVRETAIDIAGYCHVTELAPELIQVLLDPGDIFRVRKHAGIALEQAANEEVRLMLKQRSVADWDGDVDDDLRGYFLQIMWPSQISLHDLLPLVPPKRANYTGSYKIFLQYKLPESLSDADLPRMLDWLRESKVSFDITGVFGYLPSKIFARALTRMDDARIRDAVLRLLGSDEDHLHHIFHGKVEPEDIGADIRLRFWKAIVGSSLDLRALLAYGDMRQTALLSPEDFPVFIGEYRNSREVRIRDRWCMLAFWVFSTEDSTALDLLSDLARTDAVICETLATYTSCRLLPDEDNWMKRSYERQHQPNRPNTATPPPFEVLVTSALDQFEGGKTWAFWEICELLDRDPANLHASIVFPIARLSEGKAWKSLSSETRQRILNATPVYLRAQVVNEDQVWEKGQGYRPYDVLNPILVLLFDSDRQALEGLTGEEWNKWIGVFFAYSARRNGSPAEADGTLLSLARSKTQQAFMTALRRYLKVGINNDSERRLIWNLNSAWCEDIKALFVDLLHKTPLTTSAAQDILQLLVSQDRRDAEGLLTSFIQQLASPEVCSTHVPSAVVVLLTNFPGEWSVRLLDQITALPALGRAVVARLVRGYHQPSGWLAKVPPRNLALFWEWLSQQYPHDPYEQDNGGGTVTILHDIYHFRNGVFQTLMAAGTLEACEAMSEVMRRRPDDFWLGDILAQMRKTCRRKAWVRPSPSGLMQLFAATDKQLVRTAGELHVLVLDALRRFESELHGAPPSMELWNETSIGKKKSWWPKDEMNLSNCLKRFLERDLKQRGILADREVQICPRRGEDPAQLVDILVRAVPFLDDGRPGSPVSVVVEVKCAWNEGVLLNMARQLYERYLKNSEMHFGIYAVAYFYCDAWNRQPDARKSTGESRATIDVLREKLSTQAASLTSSQKLVESLVIDARLVRS